MYWFSLEILQRTSSVVMCKKKTFSNIQCSSFKWQERKKHFTIKNLQKLIPKSLSKSKAQVQNSFETGTLFIDGTEYSKSNILFTQFPRRPLHSSGTNRWSIQSNTQRNAEKSIGERWHFEAYYSATHHTQKGFTRQRHIMGCSWHFRWTNGKF